MPHFYPPPPPLVGGAQPQAPKRLTPPSNPPINNDPPFNKTSQVTLLEAVLKAWEPGPPLPQTASQLVEFGTAEVHDQPPTRSLQPLYSVLAAWEAPKLIAVWGSSLIVNNPPVNNPPPPNARRASTLASILAGWVPEPPPVVPLPKLVSPNVTTHDNPPFGLSTLLNMINILKAWEPYVAAPT